MYEHVVKMAQEESKCAQLFFIYDAFLLNSYGQQE